MINTIAKLIRDIRGTTAIEYGFLVALLALAIFGALQGLGSEKNNVFTTIYGKFQDANELSAPD